jgi:hypothetical protein
MPYTIPTLITLIFMYDNHDNTQHGFLSRISSTLGIESLEHFTSLRKWMSVQPESPDDLPRFIRFLITFSQCFDR